MNKLHRFSLLAGACLALTSGMTAQAASSAPSQRTSKAVIPEAVAAPSAREQLLLQRLDLLSSEMAALKAQVAELKQQAMPPATVVTPVAPPAQVADAGAPDVALVANGGGSINGVVAEPATVLTGYGEINYNHFSHDKSQNQADLRRLVLGVQHRFDAKTKLVTELEVEHSVSSAGDVGEVAVEQAYIERQLTDQWAMRAGLFIMPSGLLNENHEPTAYYGVERNFVETAIIPSTWREGGVQFVGNLDNGLTVQAGVSTGFDVSKWDSSDAGAAESPLGAVHQEMAQARSHDLALFGAVNWRGVPGLQLGASWFAGNAGQAQASALGNSLRVTLWDLHARYAIHNWDLSALYARGTIGGTAGFNSLGTACTGPGCYPVPRLFDGAYVQAAYKLWSSGDLSLSPFVRFERFNTQKAFANLGAGLTQDAAPTEQVTTLGVNLGVGAGVVFKADVQRFKQDQSRDRVDLGLGWSF